MAEIIGYMAALDVAVEDVPAEEEYPDDEEQ